jgi:pimeloyl-ACP methyl ester carboxylesterase
VRVSVNGTRLFIDVTGMSHQPVGMELNERPTVIVIHGGPGMDHSLLKPLFAPMAELAQVVWLDLRGHGRSVEASPSKWTLHHWAADLVALCEALEIERPVLAGASVGGTAAALAAADRPDLIGALVLTSTPVGHRIDQMLEVFERLGGEAVRETARRYWQEPDDATRAAYQAECLPLYAREPLAPEVMARAIHRPEIGAVFYASEEWREFDLCAHASQISCPTLILSGEDDPIAPITASRELLDSLPAGFGTLVRIPGGRHVLFQDAPELLREKAAEFVKDWWLQHGRGET